MTREEAIKILKAIRVYECYPKSASEETKEAIDMAIEALNSVTDSENGAVESKNDVIKRQDAIKTVIRMCSPICDWELEKKAYTDCVIDEINSLPSADITETETCQRCQDLTDAILNRQGDEIKRLKAEARPTGEWIDIDNYYSMATCSHCHKVTMFEKWGEYIRPYNFCPNCGARMDGGEEE